MVSMSGRRLFREKHSQENMKDETNRLFTLMAKTSPTENEIEEANQLLKDPAVNADFFRSLTSVLSEAVKRGVIDKATHENVLGDLLGRKPEPID